jgi:molybdate transport system substrate-binding protein
MPARTMCLRTISVLILILCISAPGSAQPKQIRVAAASDLETVMPEIAGSFEAQTGTRVELIFGSSGNFFAQIQNGAPFDLFFSADSEFPNKLMQSGRAEPGSAVVYGVGSLVLWMPPGTKCDPQVEKWNCLLKPEVSRIAIANPAHAPYGRAAVSALQAAHIYDLVRAKFVLGENISQAAQFAHSGNAQAGILAYSQVHSPAMRDGGLWEVPRDSYPRIEQTVVLLKAAKAKSAAQDFVFFVTEGAGRASLEKFGFRPPSAPPAPGERRK